MIYRTTSPRCYGASRTRCSTSELISRDTSLRVPPQPTFTRATASPGVHRPAGGWCDQLGDPLPNLKSFILPAVCRPLPSCTWRVRWCGAPSAPPGPLQAYGTEAVADPQLPGGVSTLAITYLNRLSDLLFILTRVVNGTDGDVLWAPGGERARPAGRAPYNHKSLSPNQEDAMIE